MIQNIAPMEKRGVNTLFHIYRDLFARAWKL